MLPESPDNKPSISNESPDVIRETLLNTEKTENAPLTSALIYKIAAACIDLNLMYSCYDAETIQAIIEHLNDFNKTIPIHNYFVKDSIRSSVTDRVLSDPTLKHFFMNLDSIFIQHLSSQTGLPYPTIASRFMKNIANLYTVNKEHSIYSDVDHMNFMVDVDDINFILQTNSILFTIYCFRMAFPFSAAFKI